MSALVNGHLPQYLPDGLPAPSPGTNPLYAPFWEATARRRLAVQRNPATGLLQWPPQWIAHDTHTFELDWIEVEPVGQIFSWTRSWHPVHPVLNSAVPFLIVIVELAAGRGIRMIGNLLGDPLQEVRIGAAVEAVFEDHQVGDASYTLVQWRITG